MNTDFNITCSFCPNQCDAFKALSKEHHELFDKHQKEISFKKSETIIKQGSFVNEVLYIRKGLVKLERVEQNKKNIIIDIIPSGNFVGLALLDVEEAPYSVIALKNSELCLIKSPVIKELACTNQAFNRFLFNWHRDNTIKLYNTIAHLGTKQMHGRLAATLLKLAEKNFEEEQIYNFITRKDLAILSGMSVERMNNILNELKNDLIITNDGKGFKIQDMGMMKRLERYN